MPAFGAANRAAGDINDVVAYAFVRAAPVGAGRWPDERPTHIYEVPARFRDDDRELSRRH